MFLRVLFNKGCNDLCLALQMARKPSQTSSYGPARLGTICKILYAKPLSVKVSPMLFIYYQKTNKFRTNLGDDEEG